VSADTELQHQGCLALGNLCKDSISAVDARSAALVHDATTTVLAALDAHPAHAALQRCGCFALGAFAGNAQHQASVARAGAIRAILRAMRLHPTSVDLHSSCCTALSAVCVSNARNAAAACAEGAVALIAAAMRTTISGDDANGQTRACLALRDIISSTADQNAARAAGAIEAVVMALCAHPTDELLQFSSCASLVCMLHDNTLNICAAVAAGAIDAVVVAIGASALASADTRPKSYEACCVALDVLIHNTGGDDVAHARTATNAGALEALLEHEQPRANGHHWSEASHQRLLAQLRAAAARHDAAGACAAAGCKRCAGMRARGKLCAAPGCFMRRRANDDTKKLLRCGGCLAAGYCCIAHQHADWARHKPECRRATQPVGGEPS
jgi:hypothetical protein